MSISKDIINGERQLREEARIRKETTFGYKGYSVYFNNCSTKS